ITSICCLILVDNAFSLSVNSMGYPYFYTVCPDEIASKCMPLNELHGEIKEKKTIPGFESQSD
ncbi:hypothetical protein, partial [Enterobacter hormaechei]|uniref:hypothetical protein n=1 Tax=Enterobacter hormaechei TaxID=158836 RepID=UPI001ED98E9A